MSSNKSTIKKTSWVKLLGKLWFVILFVLYFIVKGGYETFKIYQLKNKGICIEAKVYHRHYGFRSIISSYQFVWNDNYYTGFSNDNKDVKYIRKNIVEDDSNLLIGDTITIVFLESNPAINRSNSIVKKDCSCE